jgi:hypothetical protein
MMPGKQIAFHHAENAARHLYAAQSYDGTPRSKLDWEWADSEFRLLAEALGYRVERITDGINTGKPVVAGGI